MPRYLVFLRKAPGAPVTGDAWHLSNQLHYQLAGTLSATSFHNALQMTESPNWGSSARVVWRPAGDPPRATREGDVLMQELEGQGDARLIAAGGLVPLPTPSASPLVSYAPPGIRAVGSLAWSPTGLAIVSAEQGPTVAQPGAQVWDARRGAFLHRLQPFPLDVLAVAWSPRGDQIAAGAADGIVSLSWAAGLRSRSYRGLRGKAVRALAFSHDGRALAAAGDGGLVHVWTLQSASRIAAFDAHQGAVCALAWLPTGLHLASSGLDGMVRVWEVGSGRALYEHRLGAAVQPPLPLPLAWSPDGRLLASVSLREQVPSAWPQPIRLWALQVWEAEGGSGMKSIPLSVYSTASGPVQSLAWSPDGRLAVGVDRSIQVWRVPDGEQLYASHIQAGRITALGWAPADGAYLASGDDSGYAHVWSVPAAGRG
jgi:WD40 repeat protein